MKIDYFTKICISLVLIFISVVSATPTTNKLPRHFRVPSPYPYYSSLKRSISNDPTTTDYELLYYNQTLDHFNFETQEYFQQRYLLSTQYWKKPSVPNSGLCEGPVIFFAGNEGDIVFFYENSQFVSVTMPQQLNALVIFAEHRYYGESLPFGNQSFTPQNLQYLTSEQALADYAELIPYVLSVLGASNCPVFSVGGSYGGDLAAWIRMKYPNVIDGALASSAPVLYFVDCGVPYDSYNYLSTVDFAETSSEGTCADIIRRGFQQIQAISTQTNGYSQLTETFKLCSPIQNETDVLNLLSWAQAGFGYMGMADYPMPTSFLEPMPAYPVNYSCNIITNGNHQTELNALIAGLSVYFNYTGQSPCFDINVFAEVSFNVWEYQSCTEFVTPVSSNGVADMYFSKPFNLEEYIESCKKTYGVTPNPNWITSYYGVQSQLVQSSNIIFSNGRLDPWHGGGINTTQISDNIIAILIEGAAHHLDLRLPDPADPPSLTQARALEIKYISQWAQDASILKSKRR